MGSETQAQVQVLVAPLAGDGALLKNALADVKPSYLALAYPHGARELAKKAEEAAVDFARSMAKNLGVELVEVPSVGFVDAVAAVRRGVVHVKAVAKGILEVHVALFDNAPTWLNTVLLYTPPQWLMHWFTRALASVASVTTALVLKPRSCLGCLSSLNSTQPSTSRLS